MTSGRQVKGMFVGNTSTALAAIREIVHKGLC
jgi:hypothetical protein